MHASAGLAGGSETASRSLDSWLSLLQCLACSGTLRSGDGGAAIVCERCGRRTPVVNGVVRFTSAAEDPLARRTQASFGYEWTYFDDWTASGETNFRDYFAGIDLESLREMRVLDAGCGMGRHARQLAPFVRQLVAADFSAAIDAAARNMSDTPNVLCIQADLTKLPAADESFDFVYSFGVVHHLSDTERAVQILASKLRPGGRLRLYLYWKRSGWAGFALKLVDLARTATTRLPFPLLRMLCWLMSVGLFVAVIAPYRILARLGVPVSESAPLFVYTKYPFRILYNDQFDRFSAPLEKRYTSDEARALAVAAGLRDVQVRPRFGWLVDGYR